MKKLCKLFSLTAAVLLLCTSLSCGGGGDAATTGDQGNTGLPGAGDGSTPNITTELSEGQKEIAETVFRVATGSVMLLSDDMKNMSSEGGAEQNLEQLDQKDYVDVSTFFCDTGTATLNYTDTSAVLTFTNCQISGPDAAMTINGTASMQATDAQKTLTFNSLKVNYVLADGSAETLTVTGSIADDVSANTLSFNVNVASSLGTFKATGSLSYTDEGLVNGTVYIYMDNAGATCTFENINADQLGDLNDDEIQQICGL